MNIQASSSYSRMFISVAANGAAERRLGRRHKSGGRAVGSKREPVVERQGGRRENVGGQRQARGQGWEHLSLYL